MLQRLIERPSRAFAIILSLGVAIYFTWAAATDAPITRYAWLSFAAMQALNIAVMLSDPRRGD